MTEILLLVGAAIAFWAFSKSTSKKHPHRLSEIEQALRKQADLWLHRNKDVASSNELIQYADALKEAQFLANESSESMRQKWEAIRPHVLHLTSEDSLKRMDLFYSDRQQEFKAALYELVTRLDKKASAH
ncbi:MAG: hypothetical protein V4593_07320 [Pseudomonadota bacterium]